MVAGMGVEAEQTGAGTEMTEQPSGSSGILGGYHRHTPQHLGRSDREITEIA
jgi:hypothetical protein